MADLVVETPGGLADIEIGARERSGREVEVGGESGRPPAPPGSVLPPIGKLRRRRHDAKTGVDADELGQPRWRNERPEQGEGGSSVGVTCEIFGRGPRRAAVIPGEIDAGLGERDRGSQDSACDGGERQKSAGSKRGSAERLHGTTSGQAKPPRSRQSAAGGMSESKKRVSSVRGLMLAQLAGAGKRNLH